MRPDISAQTSAASRPRASPIQRRGWAASLPLSPSAKAQSTPLKASLRLLLRERRKLGDLEQGGEDDNFNVLDTRQLADTLSGTTQVMTALLGAVAAVSLASIATAPLPKAKPADALEDCWLAEINWRLAAAA